MQISQFQFSFSVTPLEMGNESIPMQLPLPSFPELVRWLNRDRPKPANSPNKELFFLVKRAEHARMPRTEDLADFYSQAMEEAEMERRQAQQQSHIPQLYGMPGLPLTPGNDPGPSPAFSFEPGMMPPLPGNRAMPGPGPVPNLLMPDTPTASPLFEEGGGAGPAFTFPSAIQSSSELECHEKLKMSSCKILPLF